MERWKNITIVFLLAVGMLGSVTFAKSSGTLLQEGLYAEEVDGDLDAAIKIYDKIITDGSAQRSHIAQALYRQGMCYLKKQNEPQAKIVFGRVVADYSDQTKVVNKVKPLLEELGNADPAALMPPETLIYVETGSPGRQIETILNMLKGTPFENPLAVFSGDKSQKSPGDMMAALMNPAMMAEFKKIRGMGVGVTGVAQNEPPVIAVLFPGKSDALRGLILAALGMLGSPVEAIEGMQSVAFSGGGGAAYDDTTVIIASPKAYSQGQLTWCVKQYKGVTSKPTLASSNKSFAKLSKKARQENALTLWANINEVFAGLSEIIPEEHIPGEIRLADGIADFKNIDDLIVFFNIQETGIAFEQNLSFKDGHHCIAYNMIRTPNLSKAGFEAVPSEAVALLSVALGESGSGQSMAASKSIKDLTGLDIGREIFANIEQINLFALPSDSSSNNGNGVPPIAANLGLAITSHNPQKTRQILTQVLTVANLVTSQTDAGQPENGIGKYQIGLANKQKLYCYMNQMNKTTVISLNPDVVETSISAIRRRRSICTSGPLNEAVNKLSPSISKLLLVNVGGGIQVADAYLKATYDNPQNPAHKSIAQLAQACKKTSIQLGTDEQINNFKLRFNIDQLPPLDNLFPVLMQLSQTDPTAKAKATDPRPRNRATIGGKALLRLKWKAGSNAKSHKIYFGTQANQLPLLAEVKGSSHDELPELEEGTRYYWRIDEVWANGTVIKGNVWSFTTGSLVALWKLDETSGSIAKDSAGNNNGTLIGDSQWQPSAGKLGGALEFDGDGDFVKIGAESDFDIADQISISAWIKVNRFDKEWQAVIAKGDSAWRLQRNQNEDSLEFACTGLKIPSGAPWGNLFGKRSVNDGQWHHVVCIYDASKMYIIIDGEEDTSQSASGRINMNSEPVYIGENSENTGRYWNGLIDDVRIYNYALRKDDVTTLYNR
ncbi:MAG: tetratricopeptide repeat protein [Planctomycetes bacterium]|nr:tetratricopeptide repeat protein [Planctomycetota bacterium]